MYKKILVLFILSASFLFPQEDELNGNPFLTEWNNPYGTAPFAEVLDADAFQAFVENGLYDQNTAKAFRKNILSKGGSEDPMVLYKQFRGKEPSTEPLLKRRGLLSQ